MRLANLVGQEHAVAMLSRAVGSGRVPHAYLFEGPAGVGKRSAAVGLALALICREAPGRGCGTCDACRRVEAGIHPDVPIFATEEAQLKIETAQAIVALAAGRPHEAPARVIIIDEADKLNVSAANCLLKTLEEPVAGNHFVLVTASPDRLLATIRSRTQRVRFKPVAATDLVALLVGRGVDKHRAETAAALADGRVARALALGQGDERHPGWAIIAALRRAASGSTAGEIFDAAAEVGNKDEKDALPEVLSLLGRLYRDALCSASGAGELVLLGEEAEAVEALAARGAPAVRRALGAVVDAEIALGSNVNAVLVVERLLMDLRASERRPA